MDVKDRSRIGQPPPDDGDEAQNAARSEPSDRPEGAESPPATGEDSTPPAWSFTSSERPKPSSWPPPGERAPAQTPAQGWPTTHTRSASEAKVSVSWPSTPTPTPSHPDGPAKSVTGAERAAPVASHADDAWPSGAEEAGSDPSIPVHVADDDDAWEEPGESFTGAIESWVGKTIAGQFRILKRLGAGGMGAIFLADQIPMNRKVVIKVIHPSLSCDPAKVERFRREARAVARFNHPHIVQVYLFGKTDDGLFYIAMEYVEGRTLDEVLKSAGRMDQARTCRIVAQIAEALGEAHAAGLIHRDLKPSNIMLAESRGGRDVVKVLDFGIAKQFAQTGDADFNLTQTGMRLGTPPYMSPEQVRAKGEIDHRSDIYSLGLIMYEMLAGARPYQADTALEYMVKHMSEPITLPTQRFPDLILLPQVETILTRCLEKDPEDRYPSVDEMQADLRAALALVDTETPRTRTRRPRQRSTSPNRILLIALLTAAIVGGAVAAYRFLGPGRHTTPSTSHALAGDADADPHGSSRTPAPPDGTGAEAIAGTGQPADTPPGPEDDPWRITDRSGSDAEDSWLDHVVAAESPTHLELSTIVRPAPFAPVAERGEAEPAQAPVASAYGAPLVADARQVYHFGRLVTFASDRAFDQVVDFYRSRLADDAVEIIWLGQENHSVLRLVSDGPESEFQSISVAPPGALPVASGATTVTVVSRRGTP